MAIDASPANPDEFEGWVEEALVSLLSNLRDYMSNVAVVVASRFAVRWLRRLLDERPSLTIEEAALAVSALSAVGGSAHEHALAALGSLAGGGIARRSSSG